ncbi:hypothetical protein [Microbacterium telephonicum]|uniref:Uncharacterized protein n=1 Tax=Microbacterium telephonicum TaxID=1714841 RepID=A0A498CLL7_9MICO|nr:hypothetical protein [Microbacterium telephonicum]RLK52851.1 hypothetical protein C7474_0809 [Microbacterium telephonicum]
MPQPQPAVPAEPEQSELDQAAEWLEKLAKDPMADAVRGRVRIVAVTPPAERGRYQECVVDLAVEAAGIAPVEVTQHVVFSRKRWPAVGVVLPARISVSVPENLEVAWDAMP